MDTRSSGNDIPPDFGKHLGDGTPAAFEGLDKIISLLNAGDFVQAEKFLSHQILHYVGRPDTTLFRIFQFNPDPKLAPLLDEFKAMVDCRQNSLLSACFATIVGPWAVDQVASEEESDIVRQYVNFADGLDRGRQRPLFEDKSDHLLFVELYIPITACNYRCPYCYLDHEKRPSLEKLKLLPQIIDRMAMIPRPIAVAISPLSEILAVPAMWPLFKNLANLPNLRFVEMFTNLSRPLDGIIKHFPLEKMAIVATYHPSQLRHPDEDTEKFLEKIKYLKAHAYDVIVNFVIDNSNIAYFSKIKTRLSDMGVYLNTKPLQGIHKVDGKEYPQAYSQDNLLKLKKWFHMDIIWHFLMGNRANIRCSAGRDQLEVRYDGLVSRCEHDAYIDGLPKYGNILDCAGPMIDSANRYCWMGGCACKNTLALSEPVMAEYRRSGTSNHLIPRPVGEIGCHPYE